MRSMTGFGRGAAVVDGRRVAVEIRAVNGRGLELKLRGRDLEAEAEFELSRLIRERVHRGTVVVGIDEEQPATSFDRRRIEELRNELETLRRGFGLADPVGLDVVAAFMGDRGQPRRTGLSWATVEGPARAALAALIAMREEEGRALATDLTARVQRIRALAAEIAPVVAELPARAGKQLEDRVRGLVAEGHIDAGRLAQEAAFLADKLDVSEELTRLATHLDRLSAWLAPGDAPRANDDGRLGRKLEFMLQEVGRELNTLGAKCQDASVSARVVEAKAELEKIREQAQNVE